MEYQNIITAYNNDDLDISSFKKMLEMIKSLVGRPSLRAEKTVFDYSVLFNDIKNLLLIKESSSNYEQFMCEFNSIIDSNFKNVLQNIKECKAWSFMKLNSKNYTNEKFQKSNDNDKIEMISVMCEKYFEFLDYQGLADIRDCLKNGNNLDDIKIKKLYFITKMFENFRNDKIKEEFFCLNRQFLKALLGYKKSKISRIDVYFSSKSKDVNKCYEEYLQYFNLDDYFDISENITLTSKTAKISTQTTIEVFSEISEIEEEKRYLKNNLDLLNKLKEKYNNFKSFEEKYISEKNKKEENKRIEISRNKVEEQIKKQKELAEKYKKIHNEIENIKTEPKRNKESAIQIKNEKEVKSISNVNNKMENGKENVIPLVFTWIGRKDNTLSQKVGDNTLSIFFNKLKNMEESSNSKVKIFLLTNAGKDETIKRVFDFNRKAKENGMPKILEGAFGGYSSFKVDVNGNVTDISKMSPENKLKIIKLLETSKYVQLDRKQIDKSENDYIRYVFSNSNNINNATSHLSQTTGKLLMDEKVARQPLSLMPFVENDAVGIDVVLKSQVKGISQLKEYYKAKYSIKSDKMLKINIERIKEFIDKNEREY